MNHLKLYESVDEKELFERIRDILSCELEIYTPYWQDTQSIDPDSEDNATKEIIKYLKEKGII